MEHLFLKAPAKINLGLSITGVRPDGYHSLESIFCKVSLFDEIHFFLRPPEHGISLACSGIPSPENSNNIVWRAAELFVSKVSFPFGLHITLHKNIPSPGGLGGGSSDAATVLKALQKLAETSFDLSAIAESLGSDVPFFLLENRAALVSGRGEILQPVELPHFHCVLVNTMEKIPTQLAYNLWDDSARHLTATHHINNYSRLNYGVWHEGKPFPVELGNSFFPVLSERFPGFASVVRELDGLTDNWGLSGSGPTFYALFSTEAEAEKAEMHLSEIFPWVHRAYS